MFNILCVPYPISSPTPDITGPVVGASPRIGKGHKRGFFSFDFYFSSGFFRLGYENDVIGAEFVNIGLEIHRPPRRRRFRLELIQPI